MTRVVVVTLTVVVVLTLVVGLTGVVGLTLVVGLALVVVVILAVVVAIKGGKAGFRQIFFLVQVSYLRRSALHYNARVPILTCRRVHQCKAQLHHTKLQLALYQQLEQFTDLGPQFGCRGCGDRGRNDLKTLSIFIIGPAVMISALF